MRILTPVLFILFVFACTPTTNTLPPGNQEAYQPVYASPVDLTRIALEPAKNTALAGKIYAIGNYILQNDLNTGIHIIDNRNRNQVKKIGFLKVPFSTEIAVKGNYLYTNNLNDLVVFDISNINNPQLVKRIVNVFPAVDQKYPPFNNVAFECPDTTKGIVVSWEKKMLTDPKCRR
ncbi:MAG: hypothetical protein WKF89_15585 [Chitinophagaceae bacterium]